MQQPLAIQFLDFDFIDVFYQVKDKSLPSKIEQWFEEGVGEQSRPAKPWTDPGPALTIDAWTEREASRKRNSSNDEDYVLLQIVHMAPLRLNHYDEAPLVVHEMVVMAWACRADWSPFAPTETRFKAFRRYEDHLFLVLNRWLSVAVVHAFKKRHLCLMFKRSTFERLLVNSRKLASKLVEEVACGMDISLGRTVAERNEHTSQQLRARELVRRVFELIDVAYIRIGSETIKPALYGASLVLTDTLDGAKRPPKPSPVGHD